MIKISNSLEKIYSRIDYNHSQQQDILYYYIKKIDDFLRIKKDTDYYVSCFTHNCDQLSQWRGYGSYAVVGFDTQKLIESLVPYQ